MAADLWPDEYDGIVSGCMGMDVTGQTVAWMNLGSRLHTAAMPSEGIDRGQLVCRYHEMG